LRDAEISQAYLCIAQRLIGDTPRLRKLINTRPYCLIERRDNLIRERTRPPKSRLLPSIGGAMPLTV